MDDISIVNLLISGKYVALTGALLVLFAGAARALLTKASPWFSTQIGGYVVAYVTAFGTFFGGALQSGTTIDLHLVLTALATALTASGVLDHFRDLVTAVKKAPAVKLPAGSSAAVMLVVMMLGTSVACDGCAGTAPTPNSVITAVVNCAAPDGDTNAKIEAEVLKLAAIIFGNDPNKLVLAETAAVNDGLTVGGCALSKVVNDWLSKKSLADAGAALDTQKMRSMFEGYRSTYAGGASFRWPTQDL